jgi:hypothetical protein
MGAGVNDVTATPQGHSLGQWRRLSAIPNLIGGLVTMRLLSWRGAVARRSAMKRSVLLNAVAWGAPLSGRWSR